MKKLLIFLLPLSLVWTDLFGQSNNDIVSFRQIPVDLYIQIGFLFVYILLGVLFLMLFIFYPRQRLNLYFALYNISLASLILNNQYFESGVYASVATHAEGFISRMIGMSILLFILYALDRVKPFYWWFVGFTLFIDFPLSLFAAHKYTIVNEVVHATFTVVCFLQIPMAFKSKNFGSRLIGVIAFAVVLININSVLYEFGVTQTMPAPVMSIIAFIITLCAIVYLASRYGRTNTSLEQQLIQVQELSEKNLRTEKEKQQILFSQNETLEKQVSERTAELNKFLEELKSTQGQLIQSEKMASLGELTAGIAHEIQNPLNFVNNFSEVNQEMVDELQAELKSGNVDEAITISNEIKKNSEKINHHGKRAGAIVKSMLQHSRVSSGQREPTDLNALCDEYVRLSYHGLRAKDKSFNADFTTNFDNSIGKINIIPQDIGRVLLNLFNNAFYVVNEKAKQNITGYSPQVIVSTKRDNSLSLGESRGEVTISVQDNGSGIPQSIKDKIFQPFFTTKPTGQGTGLGLSLSYDIVKAHGGEIKVETKEGEGSEFVIHLPAV